MLQGPDRSASRSRRSNKTRGTRANTTPQQLPDYLKDPNYKSPYAQNNSGLPTINDAAQTQSAQNGQNLQKSTDDLLDLFSSFSAGANNSSNNNNNSGNNLNTNSDDFMNPFASSVPNQLPSQQQKRPHAQSAAIPPSSGFDDFFGTSNNNNNNSNNNDPFFGNNTNTNTNNNSNNKNSNNSNNNNNNSKKKKNNNNNNSSSNDNDNDDDDDDEKGYSPRPSGPVPTPDKSKGKNKKKAKTRAARAQTAATPTTLGSPSKAAPDPPTKTKTKSIDVLPLLHAGVKANKFKFGQNKSKVRTFYLTKDNQWFCWEPVGGALQAKNNRKKIDPTRSIFIRSIREVKKNSAAMVQDLSFIPAQHKSLTISIVYDLKGTEKRVSFMAYEPFHHVMIFEAIHKLSTMGQNINRDLTNVFELYVDFEKEILPKHLRPQRFKWEPLGDKSGDTQGANNDNSNTDAYGGAMDTFDPTQEKRDRLKSF